MNGIAMLPAAEAGPMRKSIRDVQNPPTFSLATTVDSSLHLNFSCTHHAISGQMYTEAVALLCLGWFVFIFLVCGIGYVQL